MPSLIRVFIACSLDGFIAGTDDDLSWLPQPSEASTAGDHSFESFFADIGALLMGRRTFDVVQSMGDTWIYADRPVLVATTRPLESSRPSVRAVSGSIQQLVEQASEAAGDRDVYLDGGNLIRQAMDAELVDEVIVTIVPTILGGGIPLFAGVAHPHPARAPGHQTAARRHGAAQLSPGSLELSPDS